MENGREEEIGHQAAVNLANAHWPHAWTLVQGDQSACHERAICGPWRVLVGEPFGQAGQRGPEELGLLAKAKEPVLQVDGIRAAWPGASRETFGNVLDEVRRDVHGDRFRDFRVGLEGAPLGVLEVGSRVPHGGMLAPQDFEDQLAGRSWCRRSGAAGRLPDLGSSGCELQTGGAR